MTRHLIQPQAPRGATKLADAAPRPNDAVPIGGPADARSPNERELAEYVAYVEEVAAAADGRAILNHSLAHAEVILAQLFKEARHDVCILTGSLPNATYGSQRVLDSARAFAIDNPNAIVRIVSEHAIGDSALVNELRGLLPPGQVHVTQLPNDFDSSAHFAVADSKHLRYEADKEKCEAIVMFGNEKTGKRLENLFSKVEALGSL